MEQEENGTDFDRLFWDFGIPAQTVARFHYVELIFSQLKICPHFPNLTPFNVHFAGVDGLAPLTLHGSFATYRFVLRGVYISPPP